MNIYNLDIHRKCGFYSAPEEASFRCIDNRENPDCQFIEEKLSYSRLIFVTEGEMKLKVNKLDVQKVLAGNFALVPCNSYLLASVEPKSYIVTCDFMEKEPFCNRYSLSNLMHDANINVADTAGGDSPTGVSLPINPRIGEFLKQMAECMGDGIQCASYHNLKKEELFLLLGAYYSKEQLIAIFHPLFCFNHQFEQMVLRNYESVTDVKHFAAIAHMPVTTFQRKFKRYFKTSVKQWLLDRKAERILEDIRATNHSITELSQKYGFSSVSYFSNFCKHYFGKTPTELRSENNRMSNNK